MSSEVGRPLVDVVRRYADSTRADPGPDRYTAATRADLGPDRYTDATRPDWASRFADATVAPTGATGPLAYAGDISRAAGWETDPLGPSGGGALDPPFWSDRAVVGPRARAREAGAEPPRAPVTAVKGRPAARRGAVATPVPRLPAPRR